MNLVIKYCLLIVTALLLAMTGCRKDKITTDSADQLAFSLDTLKFDTVFTQRGSATREFKVYNRSKNPIIVSDVRMGGGAASPFRVNVDGLQGALLNDVRIEAEDSIYIFTEVTIDPGNVDNPFIVKDSLLFETNGNMQQVNLEAFGQDAVYIGETGTASVIDCNNSVLLWNDPRPYVILGYLYVDNCNFIIQPGTRVHLQGGVVFIEVDGETFRIGSGILNLSPTSKIDARGTLSDPVIFRTDRIEPEFEEVPGQWGGILIDAGSTGNRMNYTEIRNSSVGVRVDSGATLSIHNSTIREISSTALLGVHANITASNCLFYDSGSYGVQLEYGGTHKFYNCTFANYAANPFISHQDPVLRVSNYFVFEDAGGNRFLFENDADVYFENCIIYGSRSDEIVLDNPEEVAAGLNFTFDHCLIKADTLDTSTGFIEPIISEDPLFVDRNEQDYRLDTIISPAVDAGKLPTINIPLDLDGNMRPSGAAVDIGAFEFQE